MSLRLDLVMMLACQAGANRAHLASTAAAVRTVGKLLGQSSRSRSAMQSLSIVRLIGKACAPPHPAQADAHIATGSRPGATLRQVQRRCSRQERNGVRLHTRPHDAPVHEVGGVSGRVQFRPLFQCVSSRRTNPTRRHRRHGQSGNPADLSRSSVACRNRAYCRAPRTTLWKRPIVKFG